MNIRVQIEWIPNVYKVNNKNRVSNNSILKYQDKISKWYKDIWIENQVYGYKISNILVDFLEFENRILIIAKFNLESKSGIDFSLFHNPPLDGNNQKLYIKNIGNLQIDSYYIKNIQVQSIS